MKKYCAIFLLGLSAVCADTMDSHRDPEVAIEFYADHDGQMVTKPPRHKMDHMDDTSIRGLLEASYTFWQVKEHGLDSFRTKAYHVNLAPSLVEQSKVIEPDPPFRSGFKVSAGIEMVQRKMQLLSTYMWFWNNNASNKVYIWSPNNGYNLWSDQSQISEAQLRWRNYLQTIDLRLESMMHFNPYVSIHPFLGLMAGWENQKLNVFGKRPNTTDDQYFDLTQDWWAIGPEMGVMSKFALYSGHDTNFDLIGRVQLAELYATTKNTYNRFMRESPRKMNLRLNDRFHPVQPYLDIMLGFGVDHMFDMMRGTYVYLNAFWELQTWFFHNEMLNVDRPTEFPGDLTLQGLTVDLGVTF